MRIDLDAPTTSAARTWTISFQPEPAMYAKANESTVLLRELSHLGSVDVTLDASKLPILPDLDPEGAYLTWIIRLTTSQSEDDIRSVFEFVEGDCKLSISEGDVGGIANSGASVSITDAPALPKQVSSPAIETEIAKQESATAVVSTPATVEVSAGATVVGMAARSSEVSSASPARATIRVDLDRVDRLIDLVGELVIHQAMLTQRVSEAGLARSSNVVLGLSDLEHLTREIQDSVMAIRIVSRLLQTML